MKKDYKNKSMGTAENAKASENKAFMFPGRPPVTVMAKDRKEAEAQFAKLNAKRK